MAFADEIAKTNSERFSLVRLTVTRWASDDFVSLGGGLYEISNFPFPVAGVKRTDDNSGLELLNATEVTTTPTVDDTYQITASNSIILKAAVTPNTGDDGENIWYVDYYVFYSSSANGTRFTEDPTNASTTERLWEPRLLKEPTFSQNSDDTVFGIVKSKPSALQIANQDSEFQNYLSDTDSFYNKECVVWVVVNGEVSELFRTRVKSLQIGKTVGVTLFDPTTKLDETATFGLAKDSVYWDSTTGGVTTGQMDDNFLGKPIPIVVGISSWHQIQGPTQTYNLYYPGMATAVPDVPFPSVTVSRGQKAPVITLRQDSVGTGTNRFLGICKTLDGVRQTGSPGSPSTVATAGARPNSILCNFTFGHNYQIGDTVSWIEAATTYYGICVYDKTFTNGGTTYNLAIENLTGVATACTTSSVFQSVYSMAILCRSSRFSSDPAGLWQGDQWGFRPLMQGFDYNVFEVTLQAEAANERGYKPNFVYTYIRLVDNFEGQGNSTMSSAFDPKVDSIEWRVRAESSKARHYQMAQELCESAGLDVDTATFSATSSVTANMVFQIPEINKSKIETYRYYLSQICKTSGTYLYTTAAGKTGYAILNPPSGGDTINNDKVVNNSVKRTRNYSDVRSTVFSSNEHTPSFEGRYYVDRTFSTDKFRFLHGSDEQLEFTHFSVTGDVAERAAEVLRNRTEIYNFDVGPEFLEKQVGDSVILDVDESGGPKDLMIIGITKSALGVKITARDFGELT